MHGALFDKGNPEKPIAVGLEVRTSEVIAEFSVNLDVEAAKDLRFDIDEAIEKAEKGRTE